MIDTHSHIYSEEFDSDRAEVIARAKAAGVTKIILPNVDSESLPRMLQLESEYPGYCFAAIGLHPTSVKENYAEELAIVKKELERREYIAIGEIGIDLYWDKTHLKGQQVAFRQQIQWAKQYKLPIVIHCREAFDEIFEILEEEKSPELFGIFHCFSGTYEQALQAISYNMLLGIGGVVTFKNGKIDQFLDRIDLQHIVLETDSPYLAPIPFRGKRNESSYVVNVAAKLATVYNLSVTEIAQITTENSKRVFGI